MNLDVAVDVVVDGDCTMTRLGVEILLFSKVSVAMTEKGKFLRKADGLVTERYVMA